MTTAEMTHHLRERGVDLYLDPATGRLRYRAPAGALSSPLRVLVAEIALQYEERAGIMEFSGGLDRATAERMAAADVLGLSAKEMTTTTR